MKYVLLLITAIICSCTAQKNPSKTVKTQRQGKYYLNKVKALNEAGAVTDSLDEVRIKRDKKHLLDRP